ncbi:protein hedgehog-like [Diabrotica undecimpunctata]|uniref:protein hedgehog-like n=1 Tax=Diabrotica undecimpunctata TaxID=50387 RepID=UPI003B63F204
MEESSQGAKYGGCFSGDSTVLTSTGVRRKLSELQIGEKILAQDTLSNELIFSEVLLYLDYNPSQKREFLKLTLSSNRTLIITPSHLVLKETSEGYRTVFAKSISVGDKLLVSNNSHSVVTDSVIEVSGVVRTGVYAPLTAAGTLVVNDVVASCYAVMDSQAIAHWAFLPVRLGWNLKKATLRVWDVISRPFRAWSQDSVAVRKISEPGVHWYPKMLYTVAQYLMPSHMTG